MSEFRDWQAAAWPVPADGKPLKSAHLRALALGAVATAAGAVGRLGWGLAMPLGRFYGSDAAGAINKESLSGGKITVTGLSVVLPEGIYVRLERASAPLLNQDGEVLGLIYTLPAHAKSSNQPAPVEPFLACFANAEAATAAGATVLAEIRSAGREQRRSLHWLVPALEIGAAPESAATAAALGKAMLAAAVTAEAHQRYEWQAVAAALRLAAAQPPETPTGPFNREVARALGDVIALVRGAAGAADSEAHEAATALAIALAAAPRVAPVPEALVTWYAALAAPFTPRGPLMAWLRGIGIKRLRLPGYPRASAIGRRIDRFDVVGAKRVELSLRLRDRVAPAVRARLDDGQFSPLTLAAVPGGFVGLLSISGKAQHLDVDLPVEIDAELRETVGSGEDWA